MKKIYFRKAAAFLLACFLVFTGTKATTGTVEADTVQAAAVTTTTNTEPSPLPEFTPPDLSKYKLWDGTEDFKANTNYYITGSVKIREGSSFTLPASSRLFIADGASLKVYIGANLNLFGDLTIAPRATVTTSGKLTVSKGGSVENHGTFLATASSTVELSSVFTSYSTSTTIFVGTANIYQDGKFLNYGRATVHEKATMNITGILRSFENSYLMINGEVKITLSGRMAMSGLTSLTGSLTTSGTLTIEKTCDFRIAQGSVMEKMKSGRYDDYRKESYAVVNRVFRKAKRGIDVSAWQGVIDWNRVAKSGVDFAIIRSSYSTDRVDKMFEYNITEAKKAGIKVGVYHYCYALSVEEAIEEARFFIETVSPYEIDFPLMFDFEDNSQVGLGKQKLTEIAEAFLSEISNAGYYPMIYSYKNWLTNNLDMDKLSKYDVAVAEWGVPASTYNGDYGVWQYSCKGLVSGIEGDVDLDLCYVDYAWIIQRDGWNHLNKE